MQTDIATKPLPPTPKEHWLLGSAFYFVKDSIGFLMENCPKYNGIFRVSSRFEKVMVVYDPAYIKYVLQDNNRNYIKSFGYEVLKMLLGNGLLTSEGDFWMKQRRLIQPAFHREKLQSLTKTMTDCVDELIVELEQKAGKGPVNIQKEMMAFALNIVARSLFTSEVKSFIEEVGENMDIANESAIDRIRNPFRAPAWVPTLYNLKEKRAIAKLDNIVLKIIEQRRKSKEQHFDLLGMLMDVQDEDTGERMNDKQVRDEVMTLFLAGHETTALALTWLWFCLHNNPSAEEKAYQEAMQVLNGRTPEFADLMKLDYTRQVVEETMRLYPPAWMVGRKALEDDEIGGYLIPKGYSVLMPAFYVHRNPQLWDNPEQFNPARFEREQVKKRDRFAYFPFGGGQRLCVGNNFAMMEMQLAVAMLIQKFHFRLVDGFTPGLDPLITLRPKGGMMMEVKKRLPPKTIGTIGTIETIDLLGFYQKILDWPSIFQNRDLEEYLLAVYHLVEQYEDKEPSFGLFSNLLQEAFTAEPRAFDPAWLKATTAPDRNVMSHKFTAVKDFDKSFHSNTDNIDYVFAVLQFQIAELHKMKVKQLKDDMRYFGVDSETGNRWYNFDPLTNLECGVRRMIDGLNGEKTVDVTWRTFGEIFERGRIYE